MVDLEEERDFEKWVDLEWQKGDDCGSTNGTSKTCDTTKLASWSEEKERNLLKKDDTYRVVVVFSFWRITLILFFYDKNSPKKHIW